MLPPSQMPLLASQIPAISDFVFASCPLPNDAPPVDFLLVLGAPHIELMERAAGAFLEGRARRMIACGKHGASSGRVMAEKLPQRYQHPYDTEAEMMASILQEMGVPQGAIEEERESTNISENIRFGLRIVRAAWEEEKGKASSYDVHEGHDELSIGICCQAFCARRVLMTFSSIAEEELDGFEASCILFPANTQNITKGNWFLSPYGRARVLGELQRCGKYFC